MNMKGIDPAGRLNRKSSGFVITLFPAEELDWGEKWGAIRGRPKKIVSRNSIFSCYRWLSHF